MNWFGSASDGEATDDGELDVEALLEEPPHDAAPNPTTTATVTERSDEVLSRRK